MPEKLALEKLADTVNAGKAKILNYMKEHDTPIMPSPADKEHADLRKAYSERKATEQNERAMDSFRKAAASKTSSTGGHPMTPRTSQRAETRRDGASKEYKP